MGYSSFMPARLVAGLVASLILLVPMATHAADPITEGSTEWQNVEQAVKFIRDAPSSSHEENVKAADYIEERLKAGKIDMGGANETSKITGQTTIDRAALVNNRSAESRATPFDPAKDIDFRSIVELAGTLVHEMIHTRQNLLLTTGGWWVRTFGGKGTFEWSAWVGAIDAYEDWLDGYVKAYRDNPKDTEALRRAAIIAGVLSGYLTQFTGESAGEHQYPVEPWAPAVKAVEKLKAALDKARTDGGPLPQSAIDLIDELRDDISKAIEENVNGSATSKTSLSGEDAYDEAFEDVGEPASQAVSTRGGQSGLEAAVLDEINYVRGHPQEYARRLGADAAGRDAAAYLETLQPEMALAPTAGLAAAAAEHAADEGAHGAFDHVGADGSSAGDRMRRHGVWSGIFAEEMSLGETSADGVVRQLIVDSGDPARRHRRDLLDPLLRRAGVGCAPHRLHVMICVIDIAAAPPPPS